MMYQRPKEHGVQVFIGGMMVDHTSDVLVDAKKPDVVDVVDDHGQTQDGQTQDGQTQGLPLRVEK